jgi:hypothetical protein
MAFDLREAVPSATVRADPISIVSLKESGCRGWSQFAREATVERDFASVRLVNDAVLVLPPKKNSAAREGHLLASACRGVF